MGHQICHDVFPMTMSKDSIFAQVDDYAMQEGDYHSGLGCSIRWYDNEIQNSKEEAMEFIKKHDSGWYDQLAVPFRQVDPECLISKKTTDLRRRIKELDDEYYQKNRNIHYANVKSKTIGCKKCESKLATAYLRTNYCPLCMEDLRPESVLKSLESKKTRLESLRKQLKEEEKRLNDKSLKNSKLMWLVKTEFHV